MKKSKTFIVFLVVLLSIVSCAGDNSTTYYKVTYDGNGNTGGSVPVDENEYPEGGSISFMDNTGHMVKTGFCFNGWNTAADGHGTHWDPNDGIAPLESDILLYAEWVTYETVIDFYTDSNTITNYTGISKIVDVPSTLHGKSVLYIGIHAFTNKSLTEVTLPEGLLGIEAWTFDYNYFTEISIPSGVTEIGSYSFCHNRLTSVVIPSSTRWIGEWAFATNDLTKITLEGVSFLHSGAFDGNEITEITICADADIAGLYTYEDGSLHHTMGTYGDSFKEAYDSGGKSAGTYVYAGGAWTKL